MAVALPGVVMRILHTRLLAITGAPAVVSMLVGSILAPAAPSQIRPYRATNLGSPIGQSRLAGVLARALSPNGRFVVGFSVWEPFVWQDGVGMQVLNKLPGFRNAVADDVDANGLAVGYCGLSVSDYTAVVWDAAGNPTAMIQSGWRYSQAVATNSSGAVLLRAGIQNGFYTLPRAFLATRGSTTFVDIAPGAQASGPIDMNEAGQVLVDVDGALQLYTPGVGLSPVPNFAASRLNDAGQIGASDGTQLLRWTNGVTENLGRPPRGDFRSVGVIDAFGQIGATEWIQTSVSPPSYTKVAWIHTDGLGLRRLDTLVEMPPTVTGYEVAGISDDGRIAISGGYGSDNRAILLEPRFVSTYGTGCIGASGRAPKMLVAGVPDGGQRIVLLGADAVAGGAAAFLVSTARASAPFPGGCTALVGLGSAAVVPVPTNGAGQASLPIDLPTGVQAVAVFMQFLSLDSGAPNGAFALSNGARVDIQ